MRAILAVTAAAAGSGGGTTGLGGAVVAALGVVVATLLTLVGVIVTARQSRSAQDRTNAIEARRLRLEEEQENRRYDAELIERLRTEIGRLRDEIERLERQGHERAAAQAARCRVALGQLSDSLETLVTVVRNEVAQEAARDARAAASEHIQADHPAVDGDGDELRL